MKTERFYIIVENFSECHYFGQFPSWEDARAYLKDYEDHLSHGENYILASQTSIDKIFASIAIEMRRPD